MQFTAQKSLLLPAALLLGSLASGFAQTKSPEAPVDRRGLLGENYFGVAGAWYDFKDLSLNASGVNLESNWSIIPHLDLTAAYSWLKTDDDFGVRAEIQTLLVGVRGYTMQSWGGFYAEALGGWVRAEAGGVIGTDSVATRLGAGAEIFVTRAFTLTPFIYYQEYSDFYDSTGATYYGLKANYWFRRHIGVTGSIYQGNDETTTWTLGLNYRF